MLHTKSPTRTKHVPELKLLANLRLAALVAGDKVNQSPRVQVRAAELLKHLCAALPSPEFQSTYIHRTGLLADGLTLHIDNDMKTVTIKRVPAENVVSMHKVSINTIKGGQQ